MTVIVVAAVLVVIGAALLWARMTTARVEKRSVDAYERGLDVLGSVAKRSDAIAHVQVPTKTELARPHVHPSEPELTFRPSTSEYRPALPPRVRLEPPVPPGANPLPVFGDETESVSSRPDGVRALDAGASHPHRSRRLRLGIAKHRERLSPGATENLTEVVPVVTPIRDADARVPEPATASKIRRRTLRTDFANAKRNRRTLTGAAAAVAVGALAVGGWQLASSQSNHDNNHAASGTSAQSHTKSHSSPAPFGANNVVESTSSSNGVVTYPVPSGTYTVKFSASAPCWLGVEQSATSNGSWLAMQTLSAGGTWMYKATGPIVVRVGAPLTLSAEVNGVPLALPSGPNPYDLSFIPSNSTSA